MDKYARLGFLEDIILSRIVLAMDVFQLLCLNRDSRVYPLYIDVL